MTAAVEGMDSPTLGSGSDAPKKLDPGFKRNIKIVGGVCAVAVLIVGYIVVSAFGKSTPQNTSSVSMQSTQGTLQPNNANPTPAMQEKVLQRQTVEADEAARKGKSYVPESIGTTVPVGAPPPPPEPMQMQTQQYSGQSGMGVQEDTARFEAVKRQIGTIYGLDNQGADKIRQSLSPLQPAAPSTPNNQFANNGNANAGAVQAAASTKIKVIEQLEIYSAEFASPVKVADGGGSAFASAKITAGPFAGAYLIGQSQMASTEAVSTVFTLMRHGNKAYNIDAIALDEKTASAGMNGDVDRRILQRYVLPIGLAAAQGYFSAISKPATQIVVGPGGAVTQEIPASSQRQALDAGLSAGFTLGGQAVSRAAAAPITSTVPSAAPIGILFRSAVFEEVSK